MLHRFYLYLLSLLALLTVVAVEKVGFALSHSDLQQQLGLFDLLGVLLWGLRFDLAISAFFTLHAYLLAQILSYLFKPGIAYFLQRTTVVAAILLILLHGADSLYYEEAGRHLGYELAEGLNSGAELFSAALTTYGDTLAIQVAFMVVASLWIAFLFKRFAPQVAAPRRRANRIAAEVMLLPLLLISAGLVRGTEEIPMEPLYAYEIGDPKEATLALNGAYNAIFSVISPTGVTPTFADEPSRQEGEIVRAMYRNDVAPQFAEVKKRNVFVLLLESWSAAYMASYGHEVTTTPMFDQLRLEGLTTRAMMAGGDRTTEGIFVTFCSTQNPLGQTVAQSQLQDYQYRCLPEILKEEGWSSAFFQGTFSNTSGTGAFAKRLGFRHSYGREDMDAAKANYPMNNWGYHDPDLYAYVLEKVKELPQPFMVGINNASTHDQQVPPGEPEIVPADSRTNRYKNTLHFSDQALFDFVQAIRNDPELKDSIIILVADHSGPTPSEPFLERLIPFAILASDLEPHYLDSIVSQRDIAPTLLQLLHITPPAHFTGRSLLGSDTARYADYYSKGVLGWVEGERAIETVIGKPESLSCYDLKQGLNTHTALPCGTQEESMKQRALAFTHTSQSLLFKGQLAQFAELH